ncbi:LRR receptor kinase BAK1 [Cucurbita argyrosperma subsp. argyrosperma]|nr:LRR receptor kinase BAK1 [Cucurbita argyrosperma subsp. argyrosperma]
MQAPISAIFIHLFLFLSNPLWVLGNDELKALMDMKAALDPENQYLASWSVNGNPCGGSFEGIGCNEMGQVVNMSLQGKGLNGKLSPAIAGLKHLTGLYLHYNSLFGDIPKEIANLTMLSDLYLNVNNFSGQIPPEIGNMKNLQVLQLCYNQFTGSIPTQLSSLKKLVVLALQSNELSGAIPASLGGLDFSGHTTQTQPEPYASGVMPTRDIPETANVQSPCNHTHCPSSSKSRNASIIGVLIMTITLSAIGILTFTQYRRRKQKLGSSFDITDHRLSTDQIKTYKKNGSPLVSLEYANGWDPLADGRGFSVLAQEVFQSFRFNLEEVETATQYFSDINLLGKNNFSATYKGILRDGSVVAVKSICKTSCKSEEAEFLKGLSLLTSLRHENLVKFRGFCCSKGRGECFLIYDFVPNGNLLRYLDVKDGDSHVLEWSTRVSIIRGVAKGLAYLHKNEVNKPALVHQSISAEKLHGRYFEYEATKLCKMALLCTHELQSERPSLEAIVQELVTCSSCL